MIRHILIFAACFALGAVATLVVRTASHQPYAAEVMPIPAPVVAATPVAAAPVAPPEAKPVNTICAICGMEVDPKLPTATYQGKTIGFGCRMCPPKFAKEPDRYGPAFLQNRVVEE